jgi:hypothetical protein
VGKLRKCRLCKTARFCGEECLELAWPTHKPDCKTWRAADVVAAACAGGAASTPVAASRAADVDADAHAGGAASTPVADLFAELRAALPQPTLAELRAALPEPTLTMLVLGVVTERTVGHGRFDAVAGDIAIATSIA